MDGYLGQATLLAVDVKAEALDWGNPRKRHPHRQLFLQGQVPWSTSWTDLLRSITGTSGGISQPHAETQICCPLHVLLVD